MTIRELQWIEKTFKPPTLVGTPWYSKDLYPLAALHLDNQQNILTDLKSLQT